ncbi:MAG: deoxyribodipyrimidine photo-lyase [Fidelibacterota bacterium]
MPSKTKAVAVFWFRRDLRLEDNRALSAALESGFPVLPVFIFDENIPEDHSSCDARSDFMYDLLIGIHKTLMKHGSSLLVYRGGVKEIWKKLLREYAVKAVYVNRDYEPHAIERDEAVEVLLRENNIVMHSYKDRVIFEGDEVVKKNGMPYTVFTPYKNRWLEKFREPDHRAENVDSKNFFPSRFHFPKREDLGIKRSGITVRDYTLENLDRYARDRNVPAADAGTYLGPHLSTGSVSIRRIIQKLTPRHDVFLSELIWREFFMQILLHYPRVVRENFREKYNGIRWRNNEKEFKSWRRGETGYPLVDAGMRQLNETGYLHNRVRMVAAGFLCKHLLIDWRWGEACFSEKLLDHELSSNNGNWQWAAGTGCDAAPYFRVFNPLSQEKKFDKDAEYITTWIPDYDKDHYIKPVVEHRYARERALSVYKEGIKNR